MPKIYENKNVDVDVDEDEDEDIDVDVDVDVDVVKLDKYFKYKVVCFICYILKLVLMLTLQQQKNFKSNRFRFETINLI
jgi:hypothetical protein